MARIWRVAITPKVNEQIRSGMIRNPRFWRPPCFPFALRICVVTLLRHQDIVDGNIQDDAERQHVIDAGKCITSEPLIHRAHIRDAEPPADTCDRIAAVLK